MKLEQQPHGEVIKEAAVQNERDEGRQSALSGGGGGFGAVTVQLTEDWRREEDERTSHVNTEIRTCD